MRPIVNLIILEEDGLQGNRKLAINVYVSNKGSIQKKIPLRDIFQKKKFHSGKYSKKKFHSGKYSKKKFHSGKY